MVLLIIYLMPCLDNVRADVLLQNICEIHLEWAHMHANLQALGAACNLRLHMISTCVQVEGACYCMAWRVRAYIACYLPADLHISVARF